MAISQQDYERLFGSNKNTSKTKDDYGLATSILAGVGSGVFKIFEGAATLAATLADLGVDKNRALNTLRQSDGTLHGALSLLGWL